MRDENFGSASFWRELHFRINLRYFLMPNMGRWINVFTYEKNTYLQCSSIIPFLKDKLFWKKITSFTDPVCVICWLTMAQTK